MVLTVWWHLKTSANNCCFLIYFMLNFKGKGYNFSDVMTDVCMNLYILITLL